MENELIWIYLLYGFTGLPAAFLFAKLILETWNLTFVYFTGAILSFLTGVALSYPSWKIYETPKEWGDLVAITFILCGLFVKIRNSKPVFARFPVYLTALPLLSLFFYPLVSEAIVVKDLLRITYQGGAIIVSLLVFSINHYLYGNRIILIGSSLIFLLSFILFWFIHNTGMEAFQDIARILFATGMVTTAIGFTRIRNTSQTSKAIL